MIDAFKRAAPGRSTATKRIYLAIVGGVAAAALSCGGDTPRPAPTRAAPVVSVAPVARVKLGELLIADVLVSNVVNIGGFQFTLRFDPAQVSRESDSEGAFLSSSGREQICQKENTGNQVQYFCATTEPSATQGSETVTPGPSGDGVLAQVRLRVAAHASGPVSLRLSDVKLADVRGETILVSTNDATIEVN